MYNQQVTTRKSSPARGGRVCSNEEDVCTLYMSGRITKACVNMYVLKYIKMV